MLKEGKRAYAPGRRMVQMTVGLPSDVANWLKSLEPGDAMPIMRAGVIKEAEREKKRREKEQSNGS